MDRVVLRPRRLRLLVLLALSLALTGAGAWIVVDDQAWGYVVVGFFGLAAIVFAIALLPGAGRLELTSRGFTVTWLFRRWHVSWNDVERFYPTPLAPGPVTAVGISFNPEYESPAAPRGFLRGLGLRDEGLLPDNFGMDAAQLAALLNEWRTRYTGRADNATAFRIGVSTGESVSDVFARKPGSRRPRFRGFSVRDS